MQVTGSLFEARVIANDNQLLGQGSKDMFHRITHGCLVSNVNGCLEPNLTIAAMCMKVCNGAAYQNPNARAVAHSWKYATHDAALSSHCATGNRRYG
jgi:hypothetical protein